MSTKHFLFVLMLVCVGLGMGGTTPVEACAGCNWAGDGKIIPGGACDIRLDSPSDSYGVDYRGGMCNLSFSESLKVSCPVVRDSVNNVNGLNCAEPFFYWDGFVEEAVCVLYARQFSGNGNFFWTQGTGPAAIHGTSIPLKINNSYYRGYYHMTCLIPPKAPGAEYSCIRSFQWAEKV